MIKQSKLVKEDEQIPEDIPVLLDGGCPSESVFVSHVRFMERKQLVEKGRKRRVRVL